MVQNPSNQKTAIFALTLKGAELAVRISASIPGSACLCNYRYALPGMTLFEHISEVFPSAWRECDSIICIMSCGIAVRMVSALLEDKTVDPAVVVLDQDGRFAISLVSGHIGGANELARKVARITGGQAVITTASDLQDKPAIDLAAKSAGLLIENSGMLSRIQAAILDEEPLWIFDPDGLLLNHLPTDHGLQVINADGEPGALRSGLGISNFPSELNATPAIFQPSPSVARNSRPDAMSHNRRVLSLLPLTAVDPSGLNATLVTPALCPVKVRTSPARRRLPQSQRAVFSAAEQIRAVGTVRDARHRALVSRQRTNFAAILGGNLVEHFFRSRLIRDQVIHATRQLPRGVVILLFQRLLCPGQQRRGFFPIDLLHQRPRSGASGNRARLVDFSLTNHLHRRGGQFTQDARLGNEQGPGRVDRPCYSGPIGNL